jgi:putative nucleotidyltransferase with HDIG domain
MFTKKKNIESLDHALVFLGQDQLIKLIISAAVQSFFEQSSMGYSLCKGGLYHHAVGCAQVAEALAKKTQKVSPQKAYTAGLLHDIGKVVLDQYVAPAYPLFYRQAMEGHENVLDIEKRLFGIDHTQVGQMLAEQWSFPESLVHTVRYHHFPDRKSPHILLTIVVYLADLLLSRFQIGIEIERLDTRTLSAHMAQLDLETDRFADLVDLIPNTIFKGAVEACIKTA